MALDRGRLAGITDNLIFSLHIVDESWSETVCEWWYGKKKLSIYLEDDGTLPYFFRIPVYNDPSCTIVEGDIESLDDAIECWNWLLED